MGGCYLLGRNQPSNVLKQLNEYAAWRTQTQVMDVFVLAFWKKHLLIIVVVYDVRRLSVVTVIQLLSSCRAQAQELWCMGLVAPQCMWVFLN